MKNKKLSFIFTFLLLMGTASAAIAAPESGSEVKGYIWQVLNFAVLVAILVYFARKPLSQYLRARTEGIQKSLEEARVARELAEKALKEVEERLRLKDKEIEDILKSATASGEAERQALLEEARKMGKKISEHASANIDIELKKAKDAIRKEAAELAIEITEKKLRERLSADEQKRLVEESVSKLEARH